MKTIITFILLLLISTTAFAFTKPISAALEWWLKEQGAWEGAKVITKSEGNEYVLGYWKVTGVPRPTDPEIQVILDDYEQYLSDKQIEKKEAKDKTKQKLGMNDKQLEELKQALEITP